MIGCERFGAELSARLDGELSGPARDALDAHLAGCADCRSGLQTLGQLDAAIRAIPRPAPSPQFEARFRARLARSRARSRGPGGRLAGSLRPGLHPGRRAAQVAVAAGLLAGLAILATPRPEPPLPESDWAIVADAEHFELLTSDDLELIETLEVLETWDAPEEI